MKDVKWFYLLPVCALFISDYLFEIFESKREYEYFVLNYKPTFAENFYYFSKIFAELIYFYVLLCLIKLNYKNLYFTFIYGATVFYLIKCTLNETITLVGYELPLLNNYYSNTEHWTIIVLFLGYLIFVLYHKEKWRWDNLKSDEYSFTKVMVAARRPKRLIEYIGAAVNLNPCGSYVVSYYGLKNGFSAKTKRLERVLFKINDCYILKDTGINPQIYLKEMNEKLQANKKFNIFTNNCFSWKFCNIVKLFKVK